MKHPQLQQEESVPITAGSPECEASNSFRNNDFLPSSLSQIDPSVLQELPEELRHGILESLPKHRGSNHIMSNMPQEKLISIDNTKLWIGNPPQWIYNFKNSRILILDIIADMYLTSGSPRNLSRALQCCLSKVPILDAVSDDFDAAVGSFSEVLRQYVKLKIERDIEEIYVCLRLLKRYASYSRFYLFSSLIISLHCLCHIRYDVIDSTGSDYIWQVINQVAIFPTSLQSNLSLYSGHAYCFYLLLLG